MSSVSFNRDLLLEAFDAIGKAALDAGTRLEISVYGGSALMLASNFRFSTEDVDIAAIEKPWPAWLQQAAHDLARRNGWHDDWLNEGIAMYLSPQASPSHDHLPFGSFPRQADRPGLIVQIPSARYLLALKLRALRMGDPNKARTDLDDVQALLRTLEITSADAALAVMLSFFPQSATDTAKQRFVINHLLKQPQDDHAPRYPQTGL